MEYVIDRQAIHKLSNVSTIMLATPIYGVDMLREPSLCLILNMSDNHCSRIGNQFPFPGIVQNPISLVSDLPLNLRHTFTRKATDC